MKNKIQVFYIHGGMTFKNRKDYMCYLKNRKITLYISGGQSWHDKYLDKQLGKNFEVIRPRMPFQDNAKYSEWKIHFERHFPFLRDNLILIGESLGAVFLAKYLSENKFPKKLLAVYIICPPFDNSLPGEDLVGGFKLKSNISLIEKNCKRTTLLFSRNDDVVPVDNAKKYRKKLKKVRIIVYNHIKGHFKISKFPELVKMIKEDAK